MPEPTHLIELTATRDPATGREVWADLTVAGGAIEAVPVKEAPTRTPTPLSCLPAERMAGADPWDDIFRALRSGEEQARSGPSDVVMAPGGQMLLATSSGQAPLSRLPEEKMAAVTPTPTREEADLLRRIDPERVEEWTIVGNDLVSGWRFRLAPPYGTRPYEFFAFRSPSDANQYRVSVLSPDMDAEYGHKPHMIKVTVGGTKIPVICGPRGAAAKTIAEARLHAGKWMLYTSSRLDGRDPGFGR